MYYLNVRRNGIKIIDRQEFNTYEAALSHTTKFYRPRSIRSVLEFTTDVINGEFYVSFAALRKPECVDKNEQFYKENYSAAVKSSNAFDYDADYIFSIQSEISVREADSDDGE